ncbi:MAG: type II toxin-antitoxin system antitoxin SocA domain-containing protein [Candidatus Cybelea sp.]
MAPALEVARFFLAMADEDDELLSPMKLQKLLYYAQGFHYAILGQRLFPEHVLAWEHGPVVREVWEEYRQHGGGGIVPPDDAPEFESDTRGVLCDVWRVYGQFSAWRLREMTHDTPPWADTPRNQEISLDAMREYFATQLA